MFTANDINKLLNIPKENEHVEFKEAKEQFDTVKLYKYCVALGNEGGGKLVMGISDAIPRKVVGTSAFQDLEKVKNAIFSKLNFRVEIDEVQHPNGRVLVFKIPPRPQGTAFSFEGAYLMRIGENLHPMSEDKLREIFSVGRSNFLLNYAKHNLSQDELVNLLDTQRYFDLLNLPLPESRISILNRFAQEQFIVNNGENWNITYLGALLFAKNFNLFEKLNRKSIRVIIYKGTNKLNTIRDHFEERGFAICFEDLLSYINSQIPANEVIGQALRTEVKLFPEIAIRELIANAIVHQCIDDFSSFVSIEIYDDRIEITNPGKPLISTDRFIDEYKSRNEILTDIMRRFRICEEKSSGIDKVIATVEILQLPPPDFRSSSHHTKVTLFAPKAFEEMDRKERVRACYQHACLLYVSNKKMTNQSLRERFKLSETKSDIISKIIADAVNDGKIKIDNPDNRSRRYAKYIPYWG